MHSGSTKMYQDLNTSYWWSGMKRDVSEFVTKCMVCQKVKAECHDPNPGPTRLADPNRFPGLETQDWDSFFFF